MTLPQVLRPPDDGRWRLLCELIDGPGLRDDPGLATRRAAGDPPRGHVRRIGAVDVGPDKAEVPAHLGCQVPLGAVRDVAETVADRHVAARDMLVELELELEHLGTGRRFEVAGRPLKLFGVPTRLSSRAPLLDEDGEKVRADVAGPHGWEAPR
ncbi:CoA transferase [Pseudonocardia sp. NPDC049154]|uniref:CoA transferase n=1 Tax=Pseudonocardia sp. NPDC049154 TaxID=3155501 RepID=UPI0033D414D7